MAERAGLRDRELEVRAARRGGKHEHEPLGVAADPEAERGATGGLACERESVFPAHQLGGEWHPLLLEAGGKGGARALVGEQGDDGGQRPLPRACASTSPTATAARGP